GGSAARRAARARGHRARGRRRCRARASPGRSRDRDRCCPGGGGLMPIPFRVRHAEWIAGLFVLVAGAAVLVALLVLTRAKGTFQTHPVYYVTVSDGHGIAPGGPV